MEKQFVVLGMMSGTSLDGLDLTVSQFTQKSGSGIWDGEIQSFYSMPIPENWKNRIKALPTCLAEEWHKASVEWSAWCANQVQNAVDIDQLDLVVFSGQTVFHRPKVGWTGQLGHGAELFAGLGCRVPVVCDLRSLDVSLGGQGAPLVPVVDALLYPDYEACLNLGGFANVSCSDAENGSRIAWDIGPCNLVLNQLANRSGMPYDKNGKMASEGVVQSGLWKEWMALPYHAESAPKSLGTEWLESDFWPVMKAWESDHSVATSDLLATATSCIASHIRVAVRGKSTLVTGGGAHNLELLKLLRATTSEFLMGLSIDVNLPVSEVIDGKEAHAFGFLGLLRALGQNNVWKSATGASIDHLGGALWGSFKQGGA